MFSPMKNRGTAGIVAGALALGVTAPASARPAFVNSTGSDAPASASISQQAPRSALSHPSGSDVNWGTVAIGTGIGSMALIGVGGTIAVSRRHRRADARRATIAA